MKHFVRLLASSLSPTIPCISALYKEQSSPIGRNTHSAINRNLFPASTRQLLKNNIPSWTCKRPQWCLDLDCANCQYVINVQPSVSENFHNCVCYVTCKGWNSYGSFLRCCSWILILKLKISFLFDRQVNFLSILLILRCLNYCNGCLGLNFESWLEPLWNWLPNLLSLTSPSVLSCVFLFWMSRRPLKCSLSILSYFFVSLGILIFLQLFLSDSLCTPETNTTL